MSNTPANTEATGPAESSLRILHVLHSHGHGGAESHALTLMQAQREAGHTVCLAGPHDSWLAGQCLNAGLNCEHLAMHGLFDLVSLLRLGHLIRRWQPDVVHAHLVRAAHYATLATPSPGPVRICTAHATNARKHMQRCQHIIAVSRAVRTNLLQHGYPARQVTVVYNGIAAPDNTGERAALRRELGIPPDSWAMVNVGRFIRDKGQDQLVKALSHCPGEQQLYLIGDTETPFGQEVRALARTDARIHFPGYRADVARLLPAFDAYLLGSRREALGLSLVEAAAAGLPAIAMAVGGVPEVVEDSVSGYLVPAGDTGAMASRMLALQADPAQARAMGASARQRYQAQFTQDAMLQGVLAVYRQTRADTGPNA